MGKTGKIRRSRAQWQRIIARQAASGQSQQAFCRASGLALSSFARWHKILRREAPAERGGLGDADPGLFAELSVVGEPSGDGGAGAWEVELELGAGAVLRIRRVAPC